MIIDNNATLDQAPSFTAATVLASQSATWLRHLDAPYPAPVAHEELWLSSQLSDIRALQDGWDGYGATAPFPTAIENARMMALGIMRMGLSCPDIFPTADGTLSLEWETSTGSACLEVGVGRFSFVRRFVGDQAALLDGTVASVNAGCFTQIASLLAWRRLQSAPTVAPHATYPLDVL